MVLQERYRPSERLACRVVGQHRSTQRHPGKFLDIEEGKLRSRLREIPVDHIRWGRRMAFRLLRREGWMVNHKRVQRLSGPLPGNESGHDPQTAQYAATGPSIPTRCGRWISSSTPQLMAADSSS